MAVVAKAVEELSALNIKTITLHSTCTTFIYTNNFAMTSYILDG